MWEQVQQWDRELFVYLNSLGIEDHDQFWIFITQETNWIPLYLLFFVLYFTAFKIKKAVFNMLSIVIAFLVTIGVTNVVKGLVLRIRPNNEPTLKELIRILETPVNYSFFSGHASTSFAITTFFILTMRHKYKWVYIFYLWPILFAGSRVYVGVHYPSDLIVGAVVGIIIAILLFLIYKKILSRFE